MNTGIIIIRERHRKRWYEECLPILINARIVVFASIAIRNLRIPPSVTALNAIKRACVRFMRRLELCLKVPGFTPPITAPPLEQAPSPLRRGPRLPRRNPRVNLQVQIKKLIPASRHQAARNPTKPKKRFPDVFSPFRGVLLSGYKCLIS
jgi:NAD(P)-dependent dehydrogenase (short-subunit alcohol dehydrogenase family)